MFVSLLFGVIAYVLAQFLWYSPWAFGPLWRRYNTAIPSKGDPLVLPTIITSSMRRIWLPAVMTSVALHVLQVTFPMFSTGSFLFIVIFLWFSVIASKHLKKNTNDVQRRKWYIEDGALLWSLLWVTEVVILR